MKNKLITSSQKKVWDYYRKNPKATYEQAEKDIWINKSAIYQHIRRMEENWYVKKIHEIQVIEN